VASKRRHVGTTAVDHVYVGIPLIIFLPLSESPSLEPLAHSAPAALLHLPFSLFLRRLLDRKIMYRTASKRLVIDSLRSATRLRTIHRPILINSAPFCTSAPNQSVSSQNPNPNPNPNINSNQFQFNPTDASSTSQSTASSAAAEEARRSSGSRRPVTAYKEEQARVLRASLRHVVCEVVLLTCLVDGLIVVVVLFGIYMC